MATLSVTIYFTFPETKNLTIEEIAVVFEGEDAVNALNRLRATEGGTLKPSSSEHVEELAPGSNLVMNNNNKGL